MRGPHYDRRNGWEGLIKALDLFCDLRVQPPARSVFDLTDAWTLARIAGHSNIHRPMERTQNQKRSLGNALSVLMLLFSCLLFGRETHASTTQSDPLLLPTRNGPCQEDGALLWEYLFYRVQHPPP